MKIIIPMGGLGTRTEDTVPKPLIQVQKDCTVLEAVCSTLPKHHDYIFIVNKRHWSDDFKVVLDRIVPGYDLVLCDDTPGQVQTCLTAASRWLTNDELFIVNCDNMFLYDLECLNTMIGLTKQSRGAGLVLTEGWDKQTTHWCFAETNGNIVTNIKEREPIGKHRLVGGFYWRRAGDFVKYATKQINNKKTYNNEYYLGQTMQEAIEDHQLVFHYKINRMIPLGTKKEIEYFRKVVAK